MNESPDRNEIPNHDGVDDVDDVEEAPAHLEVDPETVAHADPDPEESSHEPDEDPDVRGLDGQLTD